MKKIEKILVVVLVVFMVVNLGFVFLKESEYSKNEFDYKVISKNMSDATDFTIDNEGNIYVSKAKSIITINNSNEEKLIFEEEFLNIKQIAVLGDELFYLYEDKLNSYNLKSNIHKVMIDSIPNFGDYTDNKLLIFNNDLYLTIGAATNSGVVSGEDAIAKTGEHDIPSLAIELTGENYGLKRTGAFMSYSMSSQKGKQVQEGIIGNATILKINKESNEFKTVAYGVRNVGGLDFNSEGKIIFSVGGIENRGDRPLEGDSDYIYVMNEESFYGWPDYSGGDRVDSARFRFEGKPIIKPATTISELPQKPFYQHDNISTLGSLAIDREGTIKNKDSIFVVDNKGQKILNIDKFGAKREIIKCENVQKILMNKESLYILEKGKGQLISISSKENTSSLKTNKNLFRALMVICLMAMIILVSLLLKVKKKKGY